VDSESLVLFRSSRSLSTERVLSLPFHELLRTWSGHTLPGPYRWIVAADRERLWFAAELPLPPPVPKHSRGDFVEWLAEADDVVELFVMARDNRYEEWHISPDGAWWSMEFVGYRTRTSTPHIPQGVEVDVSRKSTGWLGVLSVPLSSLRVGVDEIVAMEVSSCIFSRGAPEYVSSAGQPPYVADFHDPRSFRPVAFRDV
jgi:hypothetical protein